MTRQKLIIGCFAICLVALLGARASAYINGGESVEWIAANSDCIVAGKVVKAEEPRRSDHQDYEFATVAVSTTLKGEHADTLRFAVPTDQGLHAKRWLREGVPMLFFLVKNDGVRTPFPAKDLQWILRGDWGWRDAILLGKGDRRSLDCIACLTRDFNVLKEPREILARVKEVVKSHVQGKRLESEQITVPENSAVNLELYGGSSVYLIVPADQELEALGRRWCKSESSEDRQQGAGILVHFKNETNIGILKAMLADPADGEEQDYGSSPGPTGIKLVCRKKVYFVRATAFEVLNHFGVKVEQPLWKWCWRERIHPPARRRSRRSAFRFSTCGIVNEGGGRMR